MRRYQNFVAPTHLTSGIDDSVTSIPVASTGGFPDAPFVLAIGNDGIGGGELVLCTAIEDATTFAVERGFDGTSAQAHDENTLVEHTSAAIDYREGGIPRLTIAERDALADEELWEGRLVYNTDELRYDFYEPNATAWVSAGLPVGSVIPMSAPYAPPGFLLCDGQAHLRSAYPALAALYEAHGFPHGAGDGSTTFNVPDYRHRTLVGVDTTIEAIDAVGKTGGAWDHVHSGPSHTHAVGTLTTDEAGDHTHAVGTLATASGGAHTHSNPDTSSTGSHSHTNSTTGQGGGHSHSNPNTSTTGSHLHATDIGSFSTGSGGTHSHSGGVASITSGFTVSLQAGSLNIHREHTHSTSGTSHTHSVNPPNTNSSSEGNHAHTIGNTGSVSSHTHPTSNTGSTGSHSHTIADTGSAGAHTHTVTGETAEDGAHSHSISGATAAGGTGDTGAANQAFGAVYWVVRY